MLIITQEEPPASAPADGSGGWGHFAGGGARAAGRHQREPFDVLERQRIG